MKPHKHAELIKAWADGATIQWVGAVKHGGEKVWMDIENPDWESEEYRIKPEPKPDVVLYAHACFDKRYVFAANEYQDEGFDNLVLTFDGETGELKSAEVLK